MSLTRQLIALILGWLLGFWFWRGFFFGLKLYLLNKSAYKKRKEGETFREWFLYLRYREEFPKALLVLYFSFLSLYTITFFVCILLYILGISEIGSAIIKIISYFDVTWILLFGVMFWQKKPGFAYERWIKKRRGQTKK